MSVWEELGGVLVMVFLAVLAHFWIHASRP